MRILPLNASLAKLLVPRLVRWGISANQITALSLVAGLAGGGEFMQGTYAGMVAGALWFLLANLLDECDGSVARATGSSSGWGSWFDTIVGCLVHAAFFASLGYGLSKQWAENLWTLLGSLMAASVFFATLSFVVGQGLCRGKIGWLHPDPPRQAQPGRLDWLKGALRTDFSVVVLLASLAGSLRWVLWGGLLGTFLFWIPFELQSAARQRRKPPVGS